MRKLALLASTATTALVMLLAVPFGTPVESDVKDLSSPSLTIDSRLQDWSKQILKKGLIDYSAEQGLVLITDAYDGSIKASVSLANSDVCSGSSRCDDANNIVFKDWQPGSIMKPLMLAAAINEGKVTPMSKYTDTGLVEIDNRVIQNATYERYGEVDMQKVISLSINTGAIHLLTTLGNNQIDSKARETWNDYLVNKYKFTNSKKLAGIREEVGYVRPPKGGRDLNFRYAGSSFGIGLTAPPTRLVSAYSALVNGGIYHEPRISRTDNVHSERIISDATSQTMQKVLQAAESHGTGENKLQNGYEFGGKTGTAPLADGNGNYRRGNDSGSYIGYISNGDEKYVMLIRLDAPKTEKFASYVARDVWIKFARELSMNDIFASENP